MKKWLLPLTVSLFLVVSLIGQAYGWEVDYFIQPNHEAIETIPLTPSSSVIGNVSATEPINFYVNNPSGNVVFSSNETNFTSFVFTAIEDGNYTLHAANINQTQNVTATLRYTKNLVIVLQETITTTLSTTTSSMSSIIITPPRAFDFGALLTSLGSILSVATGIISVIAGVKKLIEWLHQKYGKINDPIPYVVIRIFSWIGKLPDKSLP